jgi:hypothetical protein
VLALVLVFGLWPHPSKLDWWVARLAVAARTHLPADGGFFLARSARSIGSPFAVGLGIALLTALTWALRLGRRTYGVLAVAAVTCVANDLVLQELVQRPVFFPLAYGPVDVLPSGHAVGITALGLSAVLVARHAGAGDRVLAVLLAGAVAGTSVVGWANSAAFVHLVTSTLAGVLLPVATLGAAHAALDQPAWRATASAAARMASGSPRSRGASVSLRSSVKR